MSSPFAGMLQSLMRLRGVSSTMLVDEHEGMIIDAVLQFGQDGDRVAALAASLHRKARLSAAAAGLGGVTFMELEAEGGASAPRAAATWCSSWSPRRRPTWG